MAILRRGLRSAALLLLLPALATLAPTGPAAADPVPPDGYSWPACGTVPDDDGRYCVVSVTRNGVPVPPVDYGTDGVYLDPYIDLIGAGDIRFGVQRLSVAGGGAVAAGGDVSPADTYRWVVNTGSIRPRELYGHVRDASFSVSGDTSTGWVLTLELKPTPIAWMWPPDGDGDGWADCSYEGGCGDDSTVAGLVYDGFVTGYVTDLEGEGLPAAEITDRTGLVRAYNAQDAYVLHDPDRNTLEVRMANPHLRAPGVPATGYYETFLPTDFLIHQLGVVAPSSLAGGSFVVRRTGVSTPVPFVLTHEPGGVRIEIDAITYSTPAYRIRPRATAPGRPRVRAITRVSAHEVWVRLREPSADGGAKITRYDVRCRAGASSDWARGRADRTEVLVRGVPRRAVSCQGRAVNRVGAGRWSAAAAE
ncbi:hypothetical protein [Nocardioides ferulae]|uniref:hypothetical protein n=1 Tax=Nocardioides ferulae TaxID=2340821 RepID=UPI000EB42DD8|nr:hypothetical protein [Nocardioides ferulae]